MAADPEGTTVISRMAATERNEPTRTRDITSPFQVDHITTIVCRPVPKDPTSHGDEVDWLSEPQKSAAVQDRL